MLKKKKTFLVEAKLMIITGQLKRTSALIEKGRVRGAQSPSKKNVPPDCVCVGGSWGVSIPPRGSAGYP